MSIRHQLNGPVGYGLAGFCVLVAIIIIVTSGGEASTRQLTKGTFFYDTATKALFVAEVDAIPPIAPPGGGDSKAGVRAYVYSCGECTAEARFVGYVETYPDDVVEQVRQMPDSVEAQDERDKLRAESRQVSSPDAIEWVAKSSDEGKQVVEKAMTKCPSIRSCKPLDADLAAASR